MVTLMAAQTDSAEDAESFRTLKTLRWVAPIAFACFMAGMTYSGSHSDEKTKAEIDSFMERADRIYVRKDGRELADTSGELRLLNDKVDRLLRKEGLQ